MKRYLSSIRQLTGKRGATAILVAAIMVVLLGIAAFAVDIGFTLVTRNQLQNVSDAGSLAATRKLGSIYEGMTYQQQQAYVCNPADIIPVAQAVAAQNEAAGKNITVDTADVTIGTWNPQTKQVEPNPNTGQWLDQPDAVRVIARRDSSAMSLEGPITTFFAKIFGKNTLDVKGGATAALTSQSTIEPGNLIPVGLSEEWFKQDFCGQPIRMYPTDETSCAGWNTFFGTKISEDGEACQGSGGFNAQCLRERILNRWTEAMQENPTNPSYKTPGASTGDFFKFGGGNLGQEGFEAFYNLFNEMRYHDGDGNDNEWTAEVVVYKSSGTCDNANQSIEVMGFATAIITGVWYPNDPNNPWTIAGNPPSWYIAARVVCDYVEPGRGGGGEYGTKGSIPGLVQ